MDDILGFLQHTGLSGLNSLLLAGLFLIIRSKFCEMEERVGKLWDWHLIQQGREIANRDEP